MCYDEGSRLPLIGEKAPSFEAETTQGPISFPEDYAGKWVIFFSHPADFTPVCTTEFMTFASMADEFEELNCELLGLSIDSTFSHIAWLRTISEKIEYKGMKNVEVNFPVISDLTMEVSKKFGMLQPSASTTQAVRAVFIIDPEATVRAILYAGRRCWGRVLLPGLVPVLQEVSARGVLARGETLARRYLLARAFGLCVTRWRCT